MKVFIAFFFLFIGTISTAWTAPQQKDEKSFNVRLKADFLLYKQQGISYYDVFNPTSTPEIIDFKPKVIGLD